MKIEKVKEGYLIRYHETESQYKPIVDIFADKCDKIIQACKSLKVRV